MPKGKRNDATNASANINGGATTTTARKGAKGGKAKGGKGKGARGK